MRKDLESQLLGLSGSDPSTGQLAYNYIMDHLRVAGLYTCWRNGMRRRH